MKGFIDIGLAIIAGVAILGLAFVAGNAIQENRLGATVYTTQLTDTIGTFRNQVNSSTANLNAELVAVSTTINAYGTITAENTPLATNKGGTGTSTLPAANQFLSAVGTVPTWKTLASSTGIYLTFTPTTTIIGTAGFDSAANISFTGNNTHAGTESFNATTTFASSTLFSGLSSIGVLIGGNTTTRSIAAGPANTFLVSNGTTWATSTSMSATTNYYKSDGAFTVDNTTTTIMASTTLPSAVSSTIYTVDASWSYAPTLANATTSLVLGGTTLMTCTVAGTGLTTGGFHLDIQMANSVSAQIIRGYGSMGNYMATSTCTTLVSYDGAINLGSSPVISVTSRNHPGGGPTTGALKAGISVVAN